MYSINDLINALNNNNFSTANIDLNTIYKECRRYGKILNTQNIINEDITSYIHIEYENITFEFKLVNGDVIYGGINNSIAFKK